MGKEHRYPQDLFQQVNIRSTFPYLNHPDWRTGSSCSTQGIATDWSPRLETFGCSPTSSSTLPSQTGGWQLLLNTRHCPWLIPQTGDLQLQPNIKKHLPLTNLPDWRLAVCCSTQGTAPEWSPRLEIPSCSPTSRSTFSWPISQTGGWQFTAWHKAPP